MNNLLRNVIDSSTVLSDVTWEEFGRLGEPEQRLLYTILITNLDFLAKKLRRENDDKIQNGTSPN